MLPNPQDQAGPETNVKVLGATAGETKHLSYAKLTTSCSDSREAQLMINLSQTMTFSPRQVVL